VRAAGQRRLLLVGMGTMGRPYLAAAHAQGVAVSVVDARHRLTAPATRELLTDADRVHPVAARAEEAWYRTALAAAAEDRIDGVVAFSEPHVLAAALVADELDLPGPGLRAAVTSRNKLLQRALFERCGFRQPAFHPAESGAEAAAWARGRYPVVGKPLDESGSVGVRVLADEADLLRWANEAGGIFLVEEYLSSPEVSCELLVDKGRIVFFSPTEKVTTPPPYCVELEHHVPAELGPGTEEALAELADAVVGALVQGSGIVHLELRLEPGGPAIMELAVRTPGDHIMELVGYARGVDLFAGVVALALGDAPDLSPKRDAAACAWFPSPSSGRTTAIDGLDELSALPGVVEHHVVAAVGSRIPPLRSSLDRIGAVILEAPDRAELARRLEAAKRMLRLEIADR
jgi:biotin carboxylase